MAGLLAQISGIGLVHAGTPLSGSAAACTNADARLLPPRALTMEAAVPNRKDRRFLSPLWALGLNAANAALTSAALDPACRAEVGLRVAVDNGERPLAVDWEILAQAGPKAARPERQLNEALSRFTPPLTLLHRLPNLLAGNIATQLGVCGPNRTYLGGQSAGGDAVRSALYAVGKGKLDACLVGGAFSALSDDVLLRRDAPVAFPADPAPTRDLCGWGAFLLLEGVEAAQRRGAACFGFLEYEPEAAAAPPGAMQAVPDAAEAAIPAAIGLAAMSMSGSILTSDGAAQRADQPPDQQDWRLRNFHCTPPAPVRQGMPARTGA